MIEITALSSQSLASGNLSEKIPEIYELKNVIEQGEWHNHQSVFDHTVLVLEGVERLLTPGILRDLEQEKINAYLSEKIDSHSRKDILMVATLFHDSAKKDTLTVLPSGSTMCPGHDSIAASRSEYYGSIFGFSDKENTYLARIIQNHEFVSIILFLVLQHGDRERYFSLLCDVVGDIGLELCIFMYGDLYGSDLKKNNTKGYEERINLLQSFILDFIKK